MARPRQKRSDRAHGPCDPYFDMRTSIVPMRMLFMRKRFKLIFFAVVLPLALIGGSGGVIARKVKQVKARRAGPEEEARRDQIAAQLDGAKARLEQARLSSALAEETIGAQIEQ